MYSRWDDIQSGKNLALFHIILSFLVCQASCWLIDDIVYAQTKNTFQGILFENSVFLFINENRRKPLKSHCLKNYLTNHLFPHCLIVKKIIRIFFRLISTKMNLHITERSRHKFYLMNILIISNLRRDNTKRH